MYTNQKQWTQAQIDAHNYLNMLKHYAALPVQPPKPAPQPPKHAMQPLPPRRDYIPLDPPKPSYELDSRTSGWILLFLYIFITALVMAAH